MRSNARKKLKLSFNGRLIDKIAPSETRFYATGFEPHEVTLEELEESIRLGIAFSYQFEAGYRRSENFVASDILVVDIDGGLEISEALDLPAITDFGSILYTTPSHNIDHHRFRLIFTLPHTITDPNELRFAARALTERLGGDPRQTHAAALFLGSTNCQTVRLGGSISPSYLEELVEDGRVEIANDSVANNRPTSNRSGWQIKPTQSVKGTDGLLRTMRELDTPSPVYCPFHRDEFPRAFVAETMQGRFLQCATCQKTWWMSGADPQRGAFRAFDDLVIALKRGAQPAKQQQLSPLEVAMGIDRLDPKNVFIASERYLNPNNLSVWDLSKGMTFLKSPKGTGKTTFLSNFLKRATVKFSTLEDYELEDDPESPSNWYSSEKVLLIGHRQALIRELCQRLGLNCYLDDGRDASPGLLAERKKRYGVCLDSLRKVEHVSYDIVVIDEVEQVLAHFLAETLGEKRRGIFQVFANLIRRAKQVVVLDADLGWPSFKTLEIIKTLRLEGIPDHLQPRDDTPIRIYLNNWKDKTRNLNLYDNQDHLVHDLKDAILRGQKVFVTSNSKRKIDQLEQVVKYLEEAAEIEIPHVSITSSNSKSLEIQDFILNIQSKILEYQVILSSPSLGTGVDITFDDNKQLIDRVFGFFEARVTSHFEVDQHLARVRNPKQVDVWISPQRFNFETSFEVIVDDLMRSDLVYNVEHGFGWVDRATLADKDPFLAMAALVVSKDRASKNALKLNFSNHKKDQGWTVKTVEKDAAAAVIGQATLSEGQTRVTEIEVQRLLNAKVLNESEFDSIKDRMEIDNEVVTLAERARYDRTWLELFYRQIATRELIVLDDHGRAREKVLRFEALAEVNDDPTEFRRALEAGGVRKIIRARVEILKNRQVGAALLYELLSTTPLFRDGEFLPDAEYNTNDLEKFTARSRSVKRFVEGQFGVATRRDLETKPVQHLNALLKLVGLENERTRTQKIGGKKIYFYRVHQSKLASMNNVAQRRSDIQGWQFLNKQYGFSNLCDPLE